MSCAAAICLSIAFLEPLSPSTFRIAGPIQDGHPEMVVRFWGLEDYASFSPHFDRGITLMEFFLESTHTLVCEPKGIQDNGPILNCAGWDGPYASLSISCLMISINGALPDPNVPADLFKDCTYDNGILAREIAGHWLDRDVVTPPGRVPGAIETLSLLHRP